MYLFALNILEYQANRKAYVNNTARTTSGDIPGQGELEALGSLLVNTTSQVGIRVNYKHLRVYISRRDSDESQQRQSISQRL